MHFFNQLTAGNTSVHTQHCYMAIVATDALVLKQQAISIHSPDWILNVLDQFQSEISHL